LKIKEILDHDWFLTEDKNEFNVLRKAEEKNEKTHFEIYSKNKNN